jgi:hypothetical protein
MGNPLFDAQEWLNTRFESICPEDFCRGGVLFYTALRLQTPSGFHGVWKAIDQQVLNTGSCSKDELRALAGANAVLLLADATDKEQLKSVLGMVDFINAALGENSPVLILVVHTVRPEARVPVDEEAEFAVLSEALDNGVDEIIVGEPEGMRLAWEVQNRVAVEANLVSKFEEKPDLELDECDPLGHKQELEQTIHDIVWEYLRARLVADIPSVDWNLDPGVPEYIEDYRLGGYLGHGTFGTVYQLRYRDGSASGTVVKMSDKKPMSNLTTLENIKEQVEVMKLLSDRFPHPNITKLYAIFHSETHLMFQIEDGGPSDLYRYFTNLKRRGQQVATHKVKTIVYGLFSAVCHMHQRAKIVHADLKPENIIVNEQDDNVVVKVSDFDTAKVDPDSPAYAITGTFPFSAPEILLEREYDPYAADIWSLGIVTLEVLCFMHVLEQALELSSGKKARTKQEKYQIRQRMTGKIRHYFSHAEAVNVLLQQDMRPELQDMFGEPFFVALQGMLDVVISKRLRTDRLCEVLGPCLTLPGS